MKVRIDIPDPSTSLVKFNWRQPDAADPSLVVFTQEVSRTQFGQIAPGRYEKSGGFAKPSPFQGTYVLDIYMGNSVGYSAPVTTAPFVVSPPAPGANPEVIDPHV